MATSSGLRVRVLTDQPDRSLAPLQAYLQTIAGVQLDVRSARLADLHAVQVVVLGENTVLAGDELDRLATYIRRGGACLQLVGAGTKPLPLLFGAQIGEAGPRSELRLRFAEPDSALAQRMPATFMATDQFVPLEPLAAARTVLLASWQYRHVPVATIGDEGDGRVGCLSLRCFDEPLVARLAYRMLRELARIPQAAPLGVAVLGYGPSDAVGYRHGRAVESVPGLAFHAACDLSEQRLEQARRDFPALRTTTRHQDLANDPAVDIVIIATPPNSHAALAVEFLRAGKHVVCEKPLCLTRAESEAMREAAAANGRMLTTHQNRRWDADFLAINQAIRSGTIGQPFYLEAFVGGFFHPCDYWHSHAPISGGALYDWGAHYVDSLLQLFPGPVASVTSVAHKRVWYDVTNADQERVQIRFADGREAEFLYSEVAAIRKPKWYILGTAGAIVGHWNDIRLREAHRTAFYTEQEVPVTEATPHMTLSQRQPGGELVEQQLVPPAAPLYPFHHNLADHLLAGEPLAVRAEESARVVAVLEAAARSAASGGSVEEVRV